MPSDMNRGRGNVGSYGGPILWLLFSASPTRPTKTFPHKFAAHRHTASTRRSSPEARIVYVGTTYVHPRTRRNLVTGPATRVVTDRSLVVRCCLLQRVSYSRTCQERSLIPKAKARIVHTSLMNGKLINMRLVSAHHVVFSWCNQGCIKLNRV